MARRAPSGLVVALLLSGCVSTRPLSAEELPALGARLHEGPFGEVFDATWLSLLRQGFTVTSASPTAGTLAVARTDGRGYHVEVSAQGGAQRVVLVPTAPLPRAAQLDEWDALEAETARLLRAWHDLPEWQWDARRNLLHVPRFALTPPREWQRIDFSVSRRRVVVQEARTAGRGRTPTLLVDLDRRQPRAHATDLLRDAMGLALSARARLTLPDELEALADGLGTHGVARVLDGATPQTVTWFTWDAESDTWDVHLAAACPDDGAVAACEAAWLGVVQSMVTQGFSRRDWAR